MVGRRVSRVVIYYKKDSVHTSERWLEKLSLKEKV
jgi:hypothetical protein